MCARDSAEDCAGSPPIRFAPLSCLLTVMNLIPNEIKQSSLRRRDVLLHPSNSSSELEGANSSVPHIESRLRVHVIFCTAEFAEKLSYDSEQG